MIQLRGKEKVRGFDGPLMDWCEFSGQLRTLWYVQRTCWRRWKVIYQLWARLIKEKYAVNGKKKEKKFRLLFFNFPSSCTFSAKKESDSSWTGRIQTLWKNSPMEIWWHIFCVSLSHPELLRWRTNRSRRVNAMKTQPHEWMKIYCSEKLKERKRREAGELEANDDGEMNGIFECIFTQQKIIQPKSMICSRLDCLWDFFLVFYETWKMN